MFAVAVFDALINVDILCLQILNIVHKKFKLHTRSFRYQTLFFRNFFHLAVIYRPLSFV